MKFISIITILLFAVFTSQASYSQDHTKECSCQLLKKTKENDAKVVELAEYIEASFHNLETIGFDEKFDSKSFITNVTDSQDVNTEDDYTIGFMKGVESAGNKLSQQILSAIEAGANYNLINYQYSAEDMAYYFTFRMYSEAIGINYHDYKVCSDGETLKFNDIYIYITGEAFSSTLRRIFLVTKSLENTANGINKNILLILAAKKFAENDDYEMAFSKISEIDGAMANEKFTLLMKVIYASSVNTDL